MTDRQSASFIGTNRRHSNSVRPTRNQRVHHISLLDVRLVLCVLALVERGAVDDDGFLVWDQSPCVCVLSAVCSGVGVGAEGSDGALEAVCFSACSSIGGSAFPLLLARRKIPAQAFGER
jgi:hypothetical protein